MLHVKLYSEEFLSKHLTGEVAEFPPHICLATLISVVQQVKCVLDGDTMSKANKPLKVQLLPKGFCEQMDGGSTRLSIVKMCLSRGGGELWPYFGTLGPPDAEHMMGQGKLKFAVA